MSNYSETDYDGLIILVLVIFIMGKIIGFVTWSWWWVAAIAFIPFPFVVLAALIVSLS